MDDAGGGRRGLRPVVSDALLACIESNWPLRSASPPVDLGGSASLNLLLDDGTSRFVGRVHRSHVSPQRVDALQAIRRHLQSSGLPFTTSILTVNGAGHAELDGHVVEVEPFVATDGRMDDMDRVRRALPLLGETHRALASIPDLAVPEPLFANDVAAGEAGAATSRGTARIRAWHPTPVEARLADKADALADLLSTSNTGGDLPTQLVHGDFWDDNVLFAGDDVALIADLDFLGRRPRLDDLALTLYFTSLDIFDVTSEPGALAELVSLYESGLGEPLTEQERLHLPLAMARQPLWSIGVWVADLDDEAAARAHLAGTAGALQWATDLLARRETVQAQLVAGAS